MHSHLTDTMNKLQPHSYTWDCWHHCVQCISNHINNSLVTKPYIVASVSLDQKNFCIFLLFFPYISSFPFFTEVQLQAEVSLSSVWLYLGTELREGLGVALTPCSCEAALIKVAGRELMTWRQSMASSIPFLSVLQCVLIFHLSLETFTCSTTPFVPMGTRLRSQLQGIGQQFRSRPRSHEKEVDDDEKI